MGKTRQAPEPPPGMAVEPGQSAEETSKEVPVKAAESIEVQETTTQTVTGHKVSISIPLLVVEGYAAQRTDVRCSGSEAVALKAMAQGLQAAKTRLKDGKYVRSQSDAIRWFCSQIADAIHSKE